MSAVLHDLRYAFRLLLRQRAFTFLALSTLALGIGANSAIFAVVNAVLLRPLPFRDSERLVLIEDVIGNLSKEGGPLTWSDLAEYQRSSRTFESVAGYTLASTELTGQGTPERLQALRVSPEIFPVLGLSPALGRGFTPAEDRPGSGVAVISYRLWQRLFAGDAGIVGRIVNLDRKPTIIVGVLPKDVEFPLPGLPLGGEYNVWIPLGITPQERAIVGSFNFVAVGRLKAGVTTTQARADVQAMARRIYSETPALLRAGLVLDAQVSPVAERVVRDSRKLLWLLADAVGFVLLIGCLNVANLLLGRAAGREQELAVRSSLGASRMRLLRQLFTESLLLSAGGGAAGLILAAWLVTALARIIPASVPRAATISIDWRVTAFTLAVSVIAGIMFGVMPALAAARIAESARLKSASRQATSARSSARLRGLLVVSEVALSLMLLVGGTLLIRSLIALRAVDPGFDVQHVLTARLTLPMTAYPDGASIRGFFQRAMDEFGALPGVTAAGAATLPLLSSFNQVGLSVKDPAVPSALAVNATVLGDYFQAAGIPVRRGRVFDSRDRRGSGPVVVINETMARRFFHGKDAVREQIKLGPRDGGAPWSTVIGVVADTKNEALANATKPQIYLAYSQLDDSLLALGMGRSMVITVKAASEPAALTSAMREAVVRLDPQLPVSDLETTRARVEKSLSPQWFQTGLVASFAGLALLLAAIGIYGVVSSAVAQRTREIGLRMALGANRGGVLWLVMSQGMKPVVAGVALGVVGSLGLSRLIGGFLFDVRPTDWVTFLAAPAVLCIVALAANLAPARRAARVDPIMALRHE